LAIGLSVSTRFIAAQHADGFINGRATRRNGRCNRPKALRLRQFGRKGVKLPDEKKGEPL
jgi:hypothetical protein